MRREFIHGRKFDEQWKNLGLDDDDLKNLQKILLGRVGKLRK